MRVRVLRRYFFRIFFSLLLVTSLIVAIQVVFLLTSMWMAGVNWPRFVAHEYVNRVISAMDSLDHPTMNETLDVFTQSMDDRVSGLLIRNVSTGDLLLYGRTPQSAASDDVPQKDQHLVDVTAQDQKVFSKISDVYNISAQLDEEGGFTYSVTAIAGSEDSSVVTYTVPSFISEKDIAATIFYELNGELITCFDILVINMRNYESNRYIIDATIMTITWIIPICLAIAVIVSILFSRRDTRAIVRFQEALDNIAHGNYSITLPRQHTFELEEIAHSIERLKVNLEKNRLARKEWIRSIAHDLNTPISSIRLLAEGLEDGVYQADEYFFSSLKKEIGDLSQKVTTVRYYTNLMDPDFMPDLHAVRLSELIADVVSSYADDTERIRVEIKADAQIETDYALLSRALHELINNALQADSGRISVSLDHNIIEIRNKGCLPDHPDLFEPWARGDNSRHSGGSGLGLPVTGQIMTILDGKVEISQQKDEVSARLIL